MSKLSSGRIDKFYTNSFILTLSNMTTGMISFVFSILLSRRLGAEGLGLYGLIMPVYGLLLCITSDGLVTAISKISALYLDRGEFRNLYRTLSTTFLFVASWAASVAFLVLVCHNLIALHIVRDVRASGAIMTLSAALVFVPLSAIIKGYFYGLGKYNVTSSIDILEKLLRVAILIGAVSLAVPDDVGETVTIAYLALAAGELASFLALLTCYKIQKARLLGNKGKPKSRIQLIFDVFVISVPLCVNGVLSSAISTVSSLILPRRLVAAGFTYGEALALIGRFSGMALNITTLPYIIINSMLTVLVPDLSLNISRKDYWAAGERIAQVLGIACRVGISTALVCLLVPDELGLIFYRRDDLGNMIRFSAPVCLGLFVSSPTFGILNALGKQNILLKNSLINSLQSLLLVLALTGIPALNVYGLGISIIITAITSLVLNLKEIKNTCDIMMDYNDIVILLLSGVAGWIASGFVLGLFKHNPPAVKLIVTVAASFSSVFGFSHIASWFRKVP
jgi:stage V sporulation protein B